MELEQLNTPYRPGGWTLQQVVHHLADAEMNAYFRFKRGLTEELPVAGTFREDLWAQLNDYKDTPVKAETLKGWLRVQRYGDMTLDVAVRKVLD